MSWLSQVLHRTSSTDGTENIYLRDVVGSKADTASATVTTTTSIVRYIKGLLGLHAVPSADSTDNVYVRDVVGIKTDTIKANSVVGFLKRTSPILVSKTNICNGNGAQTDNLFKVTGYVELTRIWAECSQVTDGTTLSNNSLDLYADETVELTDAGAPLDLSGAIEAGELIIKNGASASVALSVMHNLEEAVTDTAISTGTTLTAQAGTDTFIRHLFTGDANTNVTLIWYVEYKPLSTNGAITAV